MNDIQTINDFDCKVCWIFAIDPEFDDNEHPYIIKMSDRSTVSFDMVFNRFGILTTNYFSGKSVLKKLVYFDFDFT